MANKNNLNKIWKRMSLSTRTFIGILASLIVFVAFFLVKDGIVALIELRGWSPYTMISIGFAILIFVVSIGWYSAKKVKFY